MVRQQLARELCGQFWTAFLCSFFRVLLVPSAFVQRVALKKGKKAVLDHRLKKQSLMYPEQFGKIRAKATLENLKSSKKEQQAGVSFRVVRWQTCGKNNGHLSEQKKRGMRHFCAP